MADQIPPIKVALADSNPLMLSAMSEHYDRDPRFSLVAAVNSGEGFLEVSLITPIAVGVIDWILPKLGSARLIDIVRTHEVPPRMMIYAHGENSDIARQAMAAGAAGFCARSRSPEYLLDATCRIASGEMVFPFVDVRDLRHDPMHSLTKRERALLISLAQGRTNKELADDHSISVNTVKFHLRNLFDKLSVKNRAQAMAYYYSTQSGRPLAQSALSEET